MNLFGNIYKKMKLIFKPLLTQDEWNDLLDEFPTVWGIEKPDIHTGTTMYSEVDVNLDEAYTKNLEEIIKPYLLEWYVLWIEDNCFILY